MAGRGRGRGRGMSINIEALGLGREEILPAVAQPPPLYPPLQFKPVPLSQSEDLDYMLALKQEIRESFHKSSFYIKVPKKVKDIERYSDKYQPGPSDSDAGHAIDWARFPSELKDHSKKRRKITTTAKPNIKAAKLVEADDVSKMLEKLEQTDSKTENAEDAEGNEEGDEDKKKENKDDEDDNEEEEEYDEEDAEEETDYNQAYFDNGEGYGDDDEDDDEGPTY